MGDLITFVPPDALAAASGGFTPGGGASTVLGAVSDASSTTYAGSSEANGFIHLNLPLPSIPAGSVIKSVSAAFIASMVPGLIAPGQPPSTATAKADLVWTSDFSLIAESPFTALSSQADPAAGSWIETAGSFERPGGGPYVAGDVDTLLQIRLWTYSVSSANVHVQSAFLRLQYNSPPAATPSSPANGGTVSTTARPTLAFTYSDAEGDLQEAYRFKVFSGTGTVADPDNLTTAERARLVADSGDTFTNATSWRVVPSLGEDALPNGSYRWYVKARDTGSRHWGAWQSRTLTIAVTSPPTPTLTVADIGPGVGQPIALTILEGSGSPVATQFEARRSTDGGATWQLLRPSLRKARTGASATITDRDAPREATITYSVRALGEVSPGEPRPPSAWSNNQAVNNESDSQTYLKSADGTVAMAVAQLKQGIGWVLTRNEEVAALYLATQDAPVILFGRQRSPTAEVLLSFRQDSGWLAFLAAYRKQQSMLLQTCFGDSTATGGRLQLWVRLGPTLSEALITTDANDMAANQRREVTIGAWAVAEPA